MRKLFPEKGQVAQVLVNAVTGEVESRQNPATYRELASNTGGAKSLEQAKYSLVSFPLILSNDGYLKRKSNEEVEPCAVISCGENCSRFNVVA
jgi:hypothetical protein